MTEDTAEELNSCLAEPLHTLVVDEEKIEETVPLAVFCRAVQRLGKMVAKDCRFLFPRRRGGSREVLLECVRPMAIRGRF